MDIRNQFPSKYLRAAQIAGCPGGTIRVNIARLTVEKMRARGGAQEEKAVLYFERAKKGLVLNRTNGEVIGNAFGWETDGWKGHVVELYVAEVEAFGELVDAIRVRVPKAAPKEAAKKPGALSPWPNAPEKPLAEQSERELFLEPNGDSGEDLPEHGELDADGNPF
jgi:hypothetical protein